MSRTLTASLPAARAASSSRRWGAPPSAVAAGVVSMLAPWLIAANPEPVAEAMPMWLALAFSVVGPPATALVLVAGRTVARMWAARLVARGEAAKLRGRELLADKDATNDGEGRRLVVDGAGLVAAGKVLAAAADASEHLSGPTPRAPRGKHGDDE